MDEIFDDVFKAGDASALKDITIGEGKQLSQLVSQLNYLDGEITNFESLLKDLKKRKHQLQTDRIPNLMNDMGLDRVDVDGLTVQTKLTVHASIPVDNKEKAFDWLRENGLDDIIKNDVMVSFTKGQDNRAGDLVGRLEAEGYDPKQKTHIHPSTLKAFVKERFVDGKAIDLDMFGAYVATTAEIRRK